MKKLILLLLVSTISFAQNAERKYLLHKFENGFLKVSVTDGEYFIKLKTDRIAETTFVPKGESFNAISHAVVLKDAEFLYEIVKADNSLSLDSKGIDIDIAFSPFQIKYSFKGKELISEKLGYIKKDSTEILQFNLTSDEVLYGGGARVLGMDRRGNRLQLYNRAHYGYETRSELMNYTIPLVLSSKKYAVHFDNPAIGYLDLDSQKNNTLAYETISGRKTYQVIVGDDWEGLISNYTQLTGRQPLPPRWALGNFSSRFGYHSEAEARKTIQKFKEENIPVDAIILDLYWFGKTIQGTMGNLEVFRDSFPNFEKMVADFNKIGVKTITVTEPFILTTSSKWQEAVDKKILSTKKDGSPATWDFYFGNTGLIDVFKPEGKSWFWNIYKDLANKGVAGIWGDLGEPEVFPSSANTTLGKADEVHNIYGHEWAKLIFEGYQKEFPDQRSFILMRAGAAGSQRYGMIPWSGDVNRTWGGLSGQTEIALQMGMQGLGYMHSDLGGFAGANLDDELYVRWLQYGVFNPIFRPHAQEDVPSEPVFRSEKAKQLAKKAIELRYQLLPYNYNLASDNSQKGLPLMRPLFFEEPENVSLLNKSDEYLWGKDFLIAPVIEKGQTEKAIYFPKTNNWFDFYTGKKYEGGTTQKVNLAEESIPTFVRGGSFIPMVKTIQTTGNYVFNDVDIHYYFDNTIKGSHAEIYNDDGKTPNSIQKNDFELLSFSSKIDSKWVTINISTVKGDNYKNAEKAFNFILHNVDKKPKKIIINGEKVKFDYDSKSSQVLLKVIHNNQTNSNSIPDIQSTIQIKL